MFVQLCQMRLLVANYFILLFAQVALLLLFFIIIFIIFITVFVTIFNFIIIM
jgi:hypothetical protein